MLGFSQFYEFIIESKSESGSGTSFRGKLNEFAFVHAFQRYHDLKQKFKGDHEKALKALEAEGHLDHTNLPDNHPFKKEILAIANKAGHEETDRTLWDSHHAALDTINHLHKNLGEITGAPTWAGKDQTGETVERITGYNSPADMVVPTTNGWAHVSLKYSGKEKGSPTKLTQKTADQLVEHIQRAHVANFGSRDERLDEELKNLQNSYDTGSLNDPAVAKKLKAAGFEQNEKGEFPKKLSKIARYASELSKMNGVPNDEKGLKRYNKLSTELQNHFDKNGIDSSEHGKHIANLSDVYDKVIKSNKLKAGASFMDSLHAATKRIYTEGKTGQHAMIKNLLNLNPPGNGKIFVVKTQRSSKDYKKNPEEALPKVAVADHAKTLDSHVEHDKENEAYDSVKADKTSTATISAKKGHSIGRFSIDTSKSVPTIIGMAGEGIDKFEPIDHLHPSKDKNLGAPPAVETAAVQKTRQPRNPKANPALVGLSNAEKYRRVVRPTANPITSKPRPGFGGRPKPAEKEPSWNDFHPND